MRWMRSSAQMLLRAQRPLFKGELASRRGELTAEPLAIEAQGWKLATPSSGSRVPEVRKSRTSFLSGRLI
jgi:hypothetical protein